MKRPAGLPSPERIRALPKNPLRLLVSACLGGRPCGVEGKPYGRYELVEKVLSLPSVEATLVCPEAKAFGTPRDTCNIVGGDGFAVLAGRARVLTHEGEDWTEGLVEAAEQMTTLALAKKVDLAILMDISAACGSSVIYDGHRDHKNYQRGVGVCTAKLMEAGIPVISQRDQYSLELLLRHLEPEYEASAEAHDHYQGPWYREYFRVVEN